MSIAYRCKTCMRPVRKEGATWVHYDEHITHPVEVVAEEPWPPDNAARYVVRETRYSAHRMAATREDYTTALYIFLLLAGYPFVMWIGQYSPALAVAITCAILIYHFGYRHPLG